MSQPDDSFSKYSYLILLVSKTGPVGGAKTATGFFVKEDGQLYFVSASHLFNCINPMKGVRISPEEQWDSVFITYPSDDSKITQMIKISITAFRDNQIPFFYYDTSDLLCWKLPPNFNIKVNTIENYLNAFEQTNGTPDNVFFWGYPLDSTISAQSHFKSMDVSDVRATKFSGKMIGKIEQGITIDGQHNDDVDLMISPDCKRGFSGSPVFFSYDKLQGKKTFGGLVFGVDSDNHRTLIIRPQVIKQSLDKLKNSSGTYYTPGGIY